MSSTSLETSFTHSWIYSPFEWLDTNIQKGFQEGIRNIQIGWFGRRIDPLSGNIEEIGLIQRTAHTAVGIILLIPVINAVVFAILKYFNATNFVTSVELDLSGNEYLTEDCLTKIVEYLPNLKRLILPSRTEIQEFDFLKKLPKLQELNLSWNKNLTNESLATIIKHRPELTKLILDQCNNPEKEVSLVGLKNLEMLSMECCANMTHLQLDPDAKNLKELNLSYCYNLGEFDFFKYLPNLQKLNLSSNKNLRSSDLIKICEYCPNLTTLILNECWGLEKEVLVPLKNLEILSMKNCLKMTSLQLDPEATNLKEINLDSCRRLKKFDFGYAFKLQTLNLSGTNYVTNGDLEKIIERCLNLKNFSLDSEEISNKASLVGLKSLEILRMQYCPNATSLELDPEAKNLQVIDLYHWKNLNEPEEFDFLKNKPKLQEVNLCYLWLIDATLEKIREYCPSSVRIIVNVGFK